MVRTDLVDMITRVDCLLRTNGSRDVRLKYRGTPDTHVDNESTEELEGLDDLEGERLVWILWNSTGLR